jgi:hypothetical protein
MLVVARERRAGLRALVASLVLAATVATAFELFQPTNEATEEALLREAIARLPRDRAYTLVRTSYADRDRVAEGGHTHEHFPDYLVRPPAGRARVVSVTDFTLDPDLERPAFFFWGMRCHARFRPEGTPPPRGENLQPHCARMRERFRLEPVFERVVPNRGDVWIDYYGDAPRLRLGLYRIRQR